MTAQKMLKRYADAWNDHDPEAVAACFGARGTYQDPATGGPLAGEAIAGYARATFEGFPDVHFDIVNVVRDPSGALAFEWRMTGTHQGPFGGSEPTGRAVTLDGADFLALDDEGIAWLRGYFDVAPFLAQLQAG